MKHMERKRRIAQFLVIILIFTMLAGHISAASQTIYDISAANWNLVQGFSGAVDKTGAVEFTGTTAYGNGVVYKNDVDVSMGVTLDLQFTQQSLVGGSGWFAITLGQDSNSFNNDKKGVTFIVFKKTEAAVECQQNAGPWWDFPFANSNTIKVKKGATDWELYFKNSVLTNDTLIAKVPFTTVSSTIFTGDKAKIGIYVCDGPANAIKFEVANLKNIVPVEITAFDAIADLNAGKAGAATYADAAAVEAALPATVKANNNEVTVPVTAWVDTDGYNPATAGSYTFTATLGAIPYGYMNTGAYTATIEVVVAQPTEITGFDAITDINAGIAGSAKYNDTAAVEAALPATVKANNNAVTVPVSEWVDTDGYDPAAAGSYTFTAILGTIPAGFANTGAHTATVEVLVVAQPIEITAFDAIADLNAGKAGAATYADAAAVEAALPASVKANNNAVTVPVSAWVDTDGYDPATAGSYTFTATLGAIPEGFANTGAYTATIEVVVAQPTEITGFDAIPEVSAGIVGNAIYADAAAVIAALPTSVTAMGNTVTVPVTGWSDTDKYNPEVSGSYTFTAILGEIPAGYANTGTHTATIEVVLGKRVLNIEAANWDLIQGFSDVNYANGTVEFTGTTAYGNGVAYKNFLNISQEVSFDLQFTQQALVGGSGWFAITLGQDTNSLNNASKGVTFLLYYKNNAAVECAQNAGPWWDYPFSEFNTIKIKKGAADWELYFKNSVFKNDTLVAKVPFTAVPDNTFSNGNAKLGIYVSDNSSKAIKFKVSSLRNVVPSVEITSFDAIANKNAGKAGSAIYADAAAVKAALPTYVTANSGAAKVLVTGWEDTDSYNPAVAGSYTFTAILGAISDGFTNAGSHTATIEVVVEPVDKTALTAAITSEIGAEHGNPVYILTEAVYTTLSWSEYKNAIEAAITVEGNSTALQSEVDSAAEAIVTAKAALAPKYTLSIGTESNGGAGKTRVITIGGPNSGDLTGKYLIVQFTKGTGVNAKVSVVIISPESTNVSASYQTQGTKIEAWLVDGMPDLTAQNMGVTVYAYKSIN